ncbi:MAG: hypothetical protein Q4G66_11090 [bacterium]|nr:hypothetical protein [bacterium]
MRCPKCGYTSFDNLERCKKCKKNIAATVAALMGTVASATAPSFLAVANPAQDHDAAPDAADTELDLNIDDDSSLDFSSSEDELFSLDEGTAEAVSQEPVAELSDDSGIDLRLPDDFDDSPAQHEPAIDMELDLALDEIDTLGGEPLTLGKAEASEIAGPPGLDLAGLDISDLQAPEASTAQEIAFEPSLSLEDEPTQVPPTSQSSAPADADDFSLEDLQVEGLAETKPGTAVADNQYQPGMKTGTALDSFNFELDELLELNENEKA